MLLAPKQKILFSPRNNNKISRSIKKIEKSSNNGLFFLVSKNSKLCLFRRMLLVDSIHIMNKICFIKSLNILQTKFVFWRKKK